MAAETIPPHTSPSTAWPIRRPSVRCLGALPSVRRRRRASRAGYHLPTTASPTIHRVALLSPRSSELPSHVPPQITSYRDVRLETNLAIRSTGSSIEVRDLNAPESSLLPSHRKAYDFVVSLARFLYRTGDDYRHLIRSSLLKTGLMRRAKASESRC